MPSEVLTLVLAIDGLPGDVEIDVLHFEGHEGMSQLFEFEITVASTSTIDLASVVRKDATLTVQLEDDADARLFHGIVGRIEQGNPEEKWSPYRLTLVPRAWLLLHRMDSRIFQDMTVPEIVQKVLTGAGLTDQDDFKIS